LLIFVVDWMNGGKFRKQLLRRRRDANCPIGGEGISRQHRESPADSCLLWLISLIEANWERRRGRDRSARRAAQTGPPT